MNIKCPFCFKNINITFKFYSNRKCPYCNKKNHNISDNNNILNIRYIFRLLPIFVYTLLSSNTNIIKNIFDLNILFIEIIFFIFCFILAFFSELLFYKLFKRIIFKNS